MSHDPSYDKRLVILVSHFSKRADKNDHKFFYLNENLGKRCNHWIGEVGIRWIEEPYKKTTIENGIKVKPKKM